MAHKWSNRHVPSGCHSQKPTSLPLVFQSVMTSYPKVRAAIAAAEKSFEILDREPELPADGHLCPQHLEGRVEFKNVSFSYSGKADQSDFVLKVQTETSSDFCQVVCV